MTAESATWSIERVWSAITGDTTEELTTLELSQFRGLVMLGPAGAGKTTEADRLADQDRLAGATVHSCRLAEFAESTTELRQHLAERSRGANARTVLYLDALDEAMIPARRRWLAIKRWVTEDLAGTGASIRITCRSAVWPSELTQAIRELVGSESFTTAALQPLSDEDIHTAAESQGIAPAAFLERIHRSGARSLAAQPLSLRMLLRLHQSNHGLPASLRELFQNGLELLASDPQGRHDIDTQNPLSPTELLEAAERLACYMTLGGRDSVHLGDEPPPNQLGRHDVSPTVSPRELDAIRLSGVSDSTSPASFRFAHRQFAEYLAGRRLGRLPTHQAKALLAGPDGWSNGVAGPLRETAAFTAMFNADVAHWIASRDPDVIGLSDVADSNLRRDATLALLDRFRRGELTAAQLRPGELEFRGLRYDHADSDLRPLLMTRADGCSDQLECAIDLVRAWKLLSLSAELADLVLDSAATIPIRVVAGYALRDCGDATARQRLKPLIAGLPEDHEDELKGIALQCMWPDHLSTPDLLQALTPRRRPSLYGAYESFLLQLDQDEFAARGYLEAGLRWARGQASDAPDTGAMHRIAMRIAHAALHHLDDPVVSRELTALLDEWAGHYRSPLEWLPKDSLHGISPAEQHDRAPLHTSRGARRRLIDLLASDSQTRQHMMTMEHCTPGLRNVEDFRWLLDRACDEQYPKTSRENYLHLAWLLPWETSSENVDAWLRVCDDEPVKSVLGNQRSLELDSDQAKELRRRWKMQVDRSRQGERVRSLDPPPCRRVMETLRLAETKDVRYFRRLCTDLTLEPTSTRYGFQRFLTETPGWRRADCEIRARIVAAAKAYLSNADAVSEAAKAVSPKSLHVDVMAAMWLLLEHDADWLRSRGRSWWGNRCWYILRQVVPDLAGEPREPKQDILRLLNEGSPATVCQEIMALALGQDDAFPELLPSLLLSLMDVPNRELDERLCVALCGGEIAEPSGTAVAEFVLTRAPGRSVPQCLDMLGGATGATDDALEHVAVALLHRRAREAWHVLREFLLSVPERGRRVLGRVADKREARLLDSLMTQQVGELAEVLIELFPPEADREGDGAHWVTPEDSARNLRTQSISHLAALEDADAVTALRRLEDRFAGCYAWLPLVRSEAERALRLSRWSPFSIGVVADVLGAAAGRLIRSEDDVIDGIECALENYEEALSGDGGESPEDLWNTARGATPTPKAEEHVSSKLGAAVRAYFQDFAVAADREAEIHRRKVASSSGGEPGSELDILVQVPARGTVSGDAIRVPIEVKLSGNDEARTAVRAQLGERYMPQLGASHGVYVVVWMSLPRPEELGKHHRPKWPSIDAAREELRQDAERVSKDRGISIRTIVVDGSLR